MQFTELGLSAEILRAVTEQGYDTPTPIQAQAIPLVLAGSDLMAAAQTGTGKTAGFTLPILQRLSQDNKSLSVKRFKPRALVLVPTRELAMQVQQSVFTYGKHVRLRSAAIYGGVGIGPQVRQLKAGVDIVVATPGRLLDHVTQRSIDLSGIEILSSTKATACSTWASSPTFAKSWPCCPSSGRACCFRPPFPTRSGRWPPVFSAIRSVSRWLAATRRLMPWLKPFIASTVTRSAIC